DGLGAGLLGGGGRHAVIVAAEFPHFPHSVKYKCCMASADVAVSIGRWRPSSVSPEAAAFARDVVTQTGPEGRERAKNLLWAAGKLADYAIGLGLDLVPEVVLHPSTAERFTRGAPGLCAGARRRLRTHPGVIRRRRG